MNLRYSQIILSKGFTLIELLVVIAIIGLISSVVLASLNTARGKGSDAAIKSGLNYMRTQAALYYDTNLNTYNTLATTTGAGCTAAAASVVSDPVILRALTAIAAQSGAANIACGAGPTFFAIAAQLKGNSTKGFCISSTGTAKEITWNATVANNVGAGICD
jgi:prepilin-type N-terminal cleavage/methylation domain-containing protein